MSNGNLADARVVAMDIGRHAHRAHSLTTGPAWSVVGAIPGVGDPLTAVRGITSAADSLGATTVPNLIDISKAVDPSQFTFTGHKAPTMLGCSSPQRYFVGFQNEVEARGTGGLPGAFGILVASHGTLAFTHIGSDSELEGFDSGIDLGTDYDNQCRGFDPTMQYLTNTVSPNFPDAFPDAARIWAAMWQKKSEHIDRALSLDPTALSYFLSVTGPATLPDGSQVTSENVVALTQSTVYAKFAADNNARKAYLLQIARTIDEHLLGGGGSSPALFRAASKAAGEGRLLLWDADSSIEATLSRSTIAGAIPRTAAPFVDPVVIDYSANKLTYYHDMSVTWKASGCGPVRDVTVTITLTNNAPADGLSAYVAQRTDVPAYPVKVGADRVLLYYVGTTGRAIATATLDGELVETTNGTNQGHPDIRATSRDAAGTFDGRCDASQGTGRGCGASGPDSATRSANAGSNIGADL